VEAEPEPEPLPVPFQDPEETVRLRAENHQLQDRIRQLETRLAAEVAAAKRDSFEAGRREGDQRARAETAPVLERMARSLGHLAELRQDIRLKAEKDMVQLSLLIAKRILHRELSTDTNALTALARVVFDRMVRGESLRVTVHPKFAPALTAALTQTQTARVQIDPDPNWPLGTLIVRSDDGLLDASVDAQLDEISRGLTDRLT
jgi:flagellar assembly protein FliH